MAQKSMSLDELVKARGNVLATIVITLIVAGLVGVLSGMIKLQFLEGLVGATPTLEYSQSSAAGPIGTPSIKGSELITAGREQSYEFMTDLPRRGSYTLYVNWGDGKGAQSTGLRGRTRGLETATLSHTYSGVGPTGPFTITAWVSGYGQVSPVGTMTVRYRR